MSDIRDYEAESADNPERDYAYSFDFDVMHPLMMRAFEAFTVNGNVLELGSFEGAFTQRLANKFCEITCVEASEKAVASARGRLKDDVTIVNSRFEDVVLANRFDNIFMIHVLEHCDDPVKVLRRINNEWLSPNGRLFLACPNANAPSRRIAVEMGLISHNTAVTPGEFEHGHRRTYTLDTLRCDAEAAGLNVKFKSGIFFKALANFQMDAAIAQGIVSDEYLNGCYNLGQQFPDLCATVYLVCETGS